LPYCSTTTQPSTQSTRQLFFGYPEGPIQLTLSGSYSCSLA
jgi:hypothetical protein